MPFPVREQSGDPWPYEPSFAWFGKAIKTTAKEIPRKEERAKLAREGKIRTQRSRI